MPNLNVSKSSFIKGISHDHELRNQLSSTHTDFIALLESTNTYQFISITTLAKFEYLLKYCIPVKEV